MGMGTHLFYWEKFLDTVRSQGLIDPHLIFSPFSYLILSKTTMQCATNWSSNVDKFGFPP